MSNKTIRAHEALGEAHKIAFAPFVFQATVSLRKLGVLDLLFEKGSEVGLSIEEISEELSVSTYGLGVLLEIAESSDIVSLNDNEKYELTKTGYFLNYNPTINVNMNFTNDVCYKALHHLTDSIETGKPSGLKELGEWPTIYEGLSQLKPFEQQAWFEFDHHYSDDIFSDALKLIFENKPKKLFDIGGNTGKFAMKCANYDPDVSITVIDLPGQLNKALENAKANGLEDRISGHEIDWLSDNPQIPQGADTIWMCQFLDCFSEEQIVKILKICVDSMDEHTQLIIVETFTDRQRFDSSRFVLEATSLYFKVLANGNSKMYPAKVLIRLAEEAGLTIKRDIPLGEYHTMFICGKE